MLCRRGAWIALLAVGLVNSACSATGMAVTAAAGTAATAAQERGFQGALQDTEIRLNINHLWLQESEVLFRKVNLQVQEGRVLLTGNVPDPETRITAARLVWQVYGVREVMNEVEVTDKSSLTSSARDTWINARLEAKLLFDNEVSAINYSIETVNQVIYLIGLARHQEELDRVIAHAKDIPYVRRVISYVSLIDDPRRRANALPPG